jgi:hypothetical protein
MTIGLYAKIQARLEARISRCSRMLWDIETTDDLRKLTIERAQELQRFCRDEEAVMTKFVQNDLYHLIGMGHLTPPQMMKLTYLVKDWLEYRSTIKALAMNFDKISQLPGLPVRSVYKLKTWDDITLCTDMELPVIEGLPYAVSGNMIQVLAADLPRFISFWSEKAKVNFSINNFNQKLASCTEYGGVRWTVDASGNYVGIIKQDNVQQLFDGCARAAQENLVK